MKSGLITSLALAYSLPLALAGDYPPPEPTTLTSKEYGDYPDYPKPPITVTTTSYPPKPPPVTTTYPPNPPPDTTTYPPSPPPDTTTYPPNPPPDSTTNRPTPPDPTPTGCVPKNVCRQASSDHLGYSPENPVAGIPLPLKTCADKEKAAWHGRHLCHAACREQYEKCLDVYAKGAVYGSGQDPEVLNQLTDEDWGKFLGKEVSPPGRRLGRRTFGLIKKIIEDLKKKLTGGDDEEPIPDHCAGEDSGSEWSKYGKDDEACWGKGGNNFFSAQARCQAQFADCFLINPPLHELGECIDPCV